jgi:hypothetical protein
MNMLSFELTAIDIILVITVLVLVVLYWTKLANIPDERIFRGILTKNTQPEKFTSYPQNDYTECPRGFGNIKKINDDNSVSERCLGCYRIMDCYSESEEIKYQLAQI